MRLFKNFSIPINLIFYFAAKNLIQFLISPFIILAKAQLQLYHTVAFFSAYLVANRVCRIFWKLLILGFLIKTQVLPPVSKS